MLHSVKDIELLKYQRNKFLRCNGLFILVSNFVVLFEKSLSTKKFDKFPGNFLISKFCENRMMSENTVKHL